MPRSIISAGLPSSTACPSTVASIPRPVIELKCLDLAQRHTLRFGVLHNRLGKRVFTGTLGGSGEKEEGDWESGAWGLEIGCGLRPV
jgi:hypothetical protein